MTAAICSAPVAPLALGAMASTSSPPSVVGWRKLVFGPTTREVFPVTSRIPFTLRVLPATIVIEFVVLIVLTEAVVWAEMPGLAAVIETSLVASLTPMVAAVALMGTVLLSTP